MNVSRWKTPSVERTTRPTSTPAKRSALVSSGWQGCVVDRWVLAACLLVVLSACEPAFVLYAPETKRSINTALFPDLGRRGASVSLVALLDLPNDQFESVVEFDAGPGINLLGFNTGQGLGCQRPNVEELLEQLGEERFPICFDVQISQTAPLGDRTLKVEIESLDESLISRIDFEVLEALETRQDGLLPSDDALERP